VNGTGGHVVEQTTMPVFQASTSGKKWNERKKAQLIQKEAIKERNP
jgi:hypothetical protein